MISCKNRLLSNAITTTLLVAAPAALADSAGGAASADLAVLDRFVVTASSRLGAGQGRQNGQHYHARRSH